MRKLLKRLRLAMTRSTHLEGALDERTDGASRPYPSIVEPGLFVQIDTPVYNNA
jgi:hypothetical protein